MRKFLIVVLLLVGALVGLGFYRGWFSVATNRDPETGREGVQFEIDQNKAKPDIEKAKKKIGVGSTQDGEKAEGQKP
jgi:hypothetical protein